MPFDPESRARAAATAQSLAMLLDDLTRTFRVVSPVPSNDGVWGLEIRRQLLIACMEVESGLASILLANHYPWSDRPTTAHYFGLKEPLHLDGYAVGFSAFPAYEPFYPFRGWDEAEPTRSLPWYDAYNATKHNREANLEKATLRHLISAVGAAYVVATAQFGPNTFHSQMGFIVSGIACTQAPNLDGEAYTLSGAIQDWQEIDYPFPKPAPRNR